MVLPLFYLKLLGKVGTNAIGMEVNDVLLAFTSTSRPYQRASGGAFVCACVGNLINLQSNIEIFCSFFIGSLSNG